MRRVRFLRFERDHEYRPRIVAVATGMFREQAKMSYGDSLDAIGEIVDVRRRIVEDEA